MNRFLAGMAGWLYNVGTIVFDIFYLAGEKDDDKGARLCSVTGVAKPIQMVTAAGTALAVVTKRGIGEPARDVDNHLPDAAIPAPG